MQQLFTRILTIESNLAKDDLYIGADYPVGLVKQVVSLKTFKKSWHSRSTRCKSVVIPKISKSFLFTLLLFSR